MRNKLNSPRLALLRNLISEGADIFLESGLMECVSYCGRSGNLLICNRTPYMYAWRYHLSKPAPATESEVIDQIINTSDPSEILGFNNLHSSIAGSRASHSAFEIQLAKSPQHFINSGDKTGRTALSWAVEVGDLDTTEKLLIRGADPNIPDNQGSTPIFYCAPKVELLRCLLNAGANVNHINRSGCTHLQDLLMSSTIKTDLIEELWNHGANLNLHERYEGWTLLHAGIAYDIPWVVLWLLQKGVDIEALSYKGATPLLLAIWQYSSPLIILRLFEMSANHKIFDRDGDSLLHYVARYGGFEVMSILQKAGLSGINIQQRSTCDYNGYEPCFPGLTAVDIAEQRRIKNAQWALDNFREPDPDPEAWFAAFQALVNSIQAADIAEQFGDFWGNLDAADIAQHTGGNLEIDIDYLPGLPGAYINESES